MSSVTDSCLYRKEWLLTRPSKVRLHAVDAPLVGRSCCSVSRRTQLADDDEMMT